MSHNSVSLECYLGDSETAVEDSTDPGILTSQIGNFQMDLFSLGQCSSRQCGTGTICIKLTKGGTKCAKLGRYCYQTLI